MVIVAIQYTEEIQEANFKRHILYHILLPKSYEKTASISKYYRNITATKATPWYHDTLVKMAIGKNPTKDKCWRSVEKRSLPTLMLVV